MSISKRSSCHRCAFVPHSPQGLLVTVNGNPVDYHTIHPSLPIENGPAKAELYSTPQYRWELSGDSSGKEPALQGAVIPRVLASLRHKLSLAALSFVHYSLDLVLSSSSFFSNKCCLPCSI